MSGRDLGWIAGAFAAQGVNSPGRTRNQHQQATQKRRRRHARKQQAGEAAERTDKSNGLLQPRALAVPQSVADHRCLHGAEQQQVRTANFPSCDSYDHAAGQSARA
jgi:hypothetical protein